MTDGLLIYRRRISPRRTLPCPRRIQRALFATIQKEKTRMLSCFVMGAIWLFIRVRLWSLRRRTACANESHRLLRCSLYTRGSMVVSQVYRLSREPCGTFITIPIPNVWLRPNILPQVMFSLSKRRRRFQANRTRRMGTSSVCNMDT